MLMTKAQKTMALLLALVLLILGMPIALSESYSAFVSDSSATVYNEMAMKNKLAVVNKYTVVTVMNVSGKVAAVRYGNTMKYMSLSALKPVIGNATPCTVNTKTKVYRKASTSAESTTVKKGVSVYLIATSGNWALIECNGSSGFIEKKYLTVNSAGVDPSALSIAATVSASSAPVYSDAKTSAKKLATLKQGTQLTVRSVKDGWAYVEYQGNYGYCQTANLKPGAGSGNTGTLQGESAIIVAEVVNIYKTASTSSTKLGSLSQGATVNLISTVNGWSYIERGGMYGYCKSSAVSTSGVIPTPTPNTANAKPITVTASSLKIYLAADKSSKVLGTVKKGATMNLIATSGSWAFIERNGSFGYCLKSGITLTSNLATPNPLDGYKVATFTATVVTSGAKVYKSAATSASSSKIALGTNVTVTAYTSQWAYIKNGSSVGYMQVSDLASGDYKTLKSGSTGSNVKTLERALLIGGYFDAAPDTTYNTATTAAVSRFQKACGLSATGEADATTLRIIGSGKAPKCAILGKTYAKGARGDDVKRIQLRLYTLKYLTKTESVDGDYGSTTYNAVGLFQAANGLTATGKVDAKTIAKLYTEGAKALPSGKSPADGTASSTSTSTSSSSSSTTVAVSGGNQKANSPTISSTLASKTSSMPSNPSASQRIEYIIYVAQKQLGKPYVFGATGTSSFDCSGFTQYSFKQGGISLLRTAYQQGYNTSYTKISSVSALKRGDLVFFNTVSDSDSCDHVGIYLGAGWFMHASSGQHKVVVSDITSGYYNRVFSWGRRIIT